MKKLYIFIVIIAIALSGFWYFGSESNEPFSTGISSVESAKESQIVELKNGDTFNLTASIVKKVIAGVEVKMLAYNGTIPGPIIKVEKGSEVTINFTNNIDVPTTIHYHDIRLNNKKNGNKTTNKKKWYMFIYYRNCNVFT